MARLPLLLAIGLVAGVLRQQQANLSQQQKDLVRGAYTEATRAELRHYVA